MAIGVSCGHLRRKTALVFALTLAAAPLLLQADDQITKTDGTVITGQISGVDGDRVFVTTQAPNGGTVKLPYYLSDIQSVTMAAPPDIAKAASASPALAATILEPVVKQYAGLPADWVVDAMAQLADAYSAQNQDDKAGAVYAQISQLYPNRGYEIQAKAGQAKLSLAQGKTDEALAEIQPLVDKANQDLAPSPQDGRLYANAFLVYAQALAAQKKLPAALEAYLTVKTMFYQNPALADQAAAAADKLRQDNPGLGVP